MLYHEFGWSRGTIGAAVSLNLALYGLTAPFAAALMDRFGIRRVVAAALTVIAVGAGLTVWMTAPWQLWLCWGLLVGLGSGSMALAFAATVTNRWFTQRRGVVSGILTSAFASGQLIFLPVLSWTVRARPAVGPDALRYTTGLPPGMRSCRRSTQVVTVGNMSGADVDEQEQWSSPGVIVGHRKGLIDLVAVRSCRPAAWKRHVPPGPAHSMRWTKAFAPDAPGSGSSRCVSSCRRTVGGASRSPSSWRQGPPPICAP